MKNTVKVINKSGIEINYNAAVEYMDDAIREQLAAELAPCTEQEFFAAYEAAHAAAYGEDWMLSSDNPIY